MDNFKKVYPPKAELDYLLEVYGAQPVGTGYIDVIVKRNNYKSFVEAVLSSGFVIYYISWWEYCDSLDIKPKYGRGGPQSNFYSGWFSEICANGSDLDEVDVTKSIEYMKNDIFKIVESKVFHFPNETFGYQNYKALTPAFWLVVPDDWVNIQLLRPPFSIL